MIVVKMYVVIPKRMLESGAGLEFFHKITHRKYFMYFAGNYFVHNYFFLFFLTPFKNMVKVMKCFSIMARNWRHELDDNK